MEDLLLLVHRIPFPPNKGDKIRSYHLLRHLAQRYRVHLGSFIDDPADRQYADPVSRLCASTHLVDLDPRRARIASLRALFAGRPLSLDYYRNAGMQRWVDQTLQRHGIRRIVVFSSAMAQFVEHASDKIRVIDFVDVDSEKWSQYAGDKRWPLSWLYRREGAQLLRYERQLAAQCDASLFVSPAEARLFQQLAPESAGRTGYYSNGVDDEYFHPGREYANPYPAGQVAITFTGAMDYWPNVDAVKWFAQEMFPAIRANHPAVHFHIVGARPSAEVKALAQLPNVHVTGAVPDVRPYVAHARLSVAPLRIARGIQNKVLEAMAMAKPVVVSPQALEGIDAEPGRDLLQANNANEFIEAVSFLMTHDTTAMAQAARARVEAGYNWERNLARVDAMLEGRPVDPLPAASAGTVPRPDRVTS